MQQIIYPNKIILPEIEKLLNDDHPVIIKVKGTSMLPFIVGERDSVELLKPLSLKVGDIVLAHLPNDEYVIHRIIGINGDEIRLMGDGNICQVEVCQRDNISGKVLRIIRKDKSILCARRRERVKAAIWRMLLPLRRYLLAIYKLTLLK